MLNIVPVRRANLLRFNIINNRDKSYFTVPHFILRCSKVQDKRHVASKKYLNARYSWIRSEGG